MKGEMKICDPIIRLRDNDKNVFTTITAVVIKLCPRLARVASWYYRITLLKIWITNDRLSKIIVEVKQYCARQRELVKTRRAAVEGVTLNSLSRAALFFSLALTATVCVYIGTDWSSEIFKSLFLRNYFT